MNKPALIIIGNPPYRERAKADGGIVVNGSPRSFGQPLLNAFKDATVGRLGGKLANLYVYFWRWATWRVFDLHGRGAVAFLTPSSWLGGDAYTAMRAYMRRSASRGWVIDLTPEGHQPPVGTRVFPGVQHPLAIGMFVRDEDNDPTVPAHVRHCTAEGDRGDKFALLGELTIPAVGTEGRQ